MYLIVGVLMIATLIAFIAWLINTNKKNFTTFVVAFVLWIVSAAIIGNIQ